MLFIVRHAKSSWEDTHLDDFDRPLNERGEKDAPRMGERLKARGVSPQLIYASPAERTKITAVIIAEILGYSKNKIHLEKKMYHASENQLLSILHSTPDSIENIMIVGHNPGLTGFANDLLGENIDNIPTAGIVAARLKIDSWNEARWKCGRMEFFDYPKRGEK